MIPCLLPLTLVLLPADDAGLPAPLARQAGSRSEPAAVSTKLLADVLDFEAATDAALQLTRLKNQYDELVFVPGMKRFAVNGLVLPLPFAPFYQGDRLCVPVEVLTFLDTPLPQPGRLPANLRQRFAPPPVNMRCVFLDAGHGGHDPGAIGPSGLQEKEVTLEVMLALKALFEAAGVRVVASRIGDYFVTLEERARRANDSGAQVFISVHVNAAPSREAVGIETFYLGSAGPADAPGWLAGTASESQRLASSIQASMVEALGVPDRGVKQKNLSVLRNSTIPGVLVEVGFLSHPASERLLARSSYHRRLAELIYRGIAVYSQWR